MAKNRSPYTETQVAAVRAAQLERGLTASEVARLALAGELDGLDPFQISPSTARRYVARDRRHLQSVSTEASDEVLAAADEQIRRVSALITKALEVEEAKAPEDVGVDRLRQLAKAGAAVAGAAREVRRPVPGRPAAPAPTQEADDWLGSLADRLEDGG